MNIDRTLTRAFALFKYFQEDYPNFDGEIPDDEFYLQFKKITDGLTLSSFNYFKTDISMLGLIIRQGKFSRLNQKKWFEFQKKSTKLEIEEIERLYQKIKGEIQND